MEQDLSGFSCRGRDESVQPLAGEFIHIQKFKTCVKILLRRLPVLARDHPNAPARALNGRLAVLQLKAVLTAVKPLQGFRKHDGNAAHPDILGARGKALLLTNRLDLDLAGQMKPRKFPFIKTVPQRVHDLLDFTKAS